MLKDLSLKNVGPAKEMTLSFAERLNILTGDNGLGKTFVLDIAWYALTRSWAANPAFPHQSIGVKPSTIGFTVQGMPDQTAHYDYSRQLWTFISGVSFLPGLIVYAKVDGGFSVWDPARNTWPGPGINYLKSPRKPWAYHFRTEDIWDGLREKGEKIDKEHVLCQGLLEDWIRWQYMDGKVFSLFTDVLAELSPCPGEMLTVGEPTRVSLEDVRDIPTIQMPYGLVPVTLASAGMKRILALAYLLVWTWSEHKRASEFLNRPSTDRMVFLFDEVECHLHPQWQRVILPAILKAINKLSADIQVQVIASTHAPLVLASIETEFSEEKDKLISFDLHDGEVRVSEIPWAKQGDVDSWLVSDTFGLKQARSKEAENAIENAEAYMRKYHEKQPPDLSERDLIHKELLRVLPGHDPFWPRWIVRTEIESSDEEEQ